MAEDRASSRLIRKRLAHRRGVRPDLATAQTNIVAFSLAPDAANIVGRARARGVLPLAFGARNLRAVTHLDVTRERYERAAGIVVEVFDRAG